MANTNTPKMAHNSTTMTYKLHRPLYIYIHIYMYIYDTHPQNRNIYTMFVQYSIYSYSIYSYSIYSYSIYSYAQDTDLEHLPLGAKTRRN